MQFYKISIELSAKSNVASKKAKSKKIKIMHLIFMHNFGFFSSFNFKLCLVFLLSFKINEKKEKVMRFTLMHNFDSFALFFSKK